MASEDNTDSGPSVQFSWNFPLVRVMTGTLASVGSTVNQKRPGIVTDEVADRITESDNKDSTEEPEVVEEDDGPLNDIQDRISDLRDRDTSDLGVNGTEPNVTFNDDVFVPLRSDVDVGGSVSWTNNSDENVTIAFENGDRLDVASGNTQSKEFNEPGLVQFQLVSRPQEDVCGAVLVGDDAPTPVLPCESDLDREVFEEESENAVELSAPSSMSNTADEKENSWG